MITVLVGTNRPDANSRKVTQILADLYQSNGTQAQVLDLEKLPPEVFTPEAYANKPPRFEPFAKAILGSEGLHVVTPEYNGSFPGVLKYFIDLLPFPESFEGRPVAFTGVAAGTFGGLRPVEQLQQVFGYRNACIFPERVFVMKVHESFDDAGEIIDGSLLSRLKRQSSNFAAFAKRNRINA